MEQVWQFLVRMHHLLGTQYFSGQEIVLLFDCWFLFPTHVRMPRYHLFMINVDLG
jgi:hypothetical protein